MAIADDDVAVVLKIFLSIFFGWNAWCIRKSGSNETENVRGTKLKQNEFCFPSKKEVCTVVCSVHAKRYGATVNENKKKKQPTIRN